MKELYRVAGAQNKPTTFLFDETQIKYETFVEDINNILTSGEVPNLFSKEEISGVVDEVCPCSVQPSSFGKIAGTTYRCTAAVGAACPRCESYLRCGLNVPPHAGCVRAGA